MRGNLPPRDPAPFADVPGADGSQDYKHSDICECNGGAPCDCPNCDHPDCSYQQDEDAPYYIGGMSIREERVAARNEE